VEVLELRVEAGLEQPIRRLAAERAEVLVRAAALDVAQQLVHARVAPDVVPARDHHGLVEQREVLRPEPALGFAA
jgi:hypothetical protein